MNPVYRSVRPLAFTVTILMLVTPTAFAQQNVPSISWTASDPGQGVTTQTPSGYTTFTVSNDTKVGYALSIYRLKDGASLDAFKVLDAKLAQTFASGGNANTLINQALELVDVLTEVDVSPGASQSVGVVLEPGTYLLDGNADVEQGVPTQVYHTFSVSGEARAQAPIPDAEVQLSEFAFSIPTIKAGPQVWKVTDTGKEVHHMVLFRLNQGKTVADFMPWLQSQKGPPPTQDAGYIGVASAGQTSYHTLDFKLGTYIAICFMPNHAEGGDGAPHFTHGMVQSFQVADN